jgi:hypothetical protein
MGPDHFVEDLLIHLGSHGHGPLQRLELTKHLDHAHRRLSRMHVRRLKVSLVELKLLGSDWLVCNRGALPQQKRSGASFDQRFRSGKLDYFKLGEGCTILKELPRWRNVNFGIWGNLDRAVETIQNGPAFGRLKPTGWGNPEVSGARVELSAPTAE